MRFKTGGIAILLIDRVNEPGDSLNRGAGEAWTLATASMGGMVHTSSQYS